jgi:hypothetical protein
MPINDSFIGALTMELSAPLGASTKSCAVGTSPHRLAFIENSSIQNICAPGSGLCNAKKWRPRNAINQRR